MQDFISLQVDNQPHPALVEILNLLDIPSNENFTYMVQQAQKYLLRKKGLERWEIGESQWEVKRNEIISLLKELGFINSIIPEGGSYSYAIIFGFVTIDMGRQFNFMTRYLDEAVIKHCVLLTSDLILPDEVSYAKKLAETESEMMQRLYHASSFSNIPFTLVSEPMKGIHRPTTDDTVKAWLATKPVPGKCLVVSAQPFIRRQTRILQTIFPAHFSFFPSGPGSDDKPLAFYLDELARTLYQEQQLLLRSA